MNRKLRALLSPMAALIAGATARSQAERVESDAQQRRLVAALSRGGRGRYRGRRRTPHVPRVGGIAHPPTARLRKCGAWGKR